MHYEANSGADEKETFIKLVENFAKAHENSRIILIGCGDSYVELASDCKNALPKNVTVPYIDIDKPVAQSGAPP